MKSLLLTTVTVFLFLSVSLAMYCGFSDSTVCTATGNIPTGYYFTPSENIPCIVRGQSTDITIQFRQWSMSPWLGFEELRIDTVDNPPVDLCWATNGIGNLYNGGRTPSGISYLRISEITYANPGQYRLKVWLKTDMFVDTNSIIRNAETKGVVICLQG